MENQGINNSNIPRAPSYESSQATSVSAGRREVANAPNRKRYLEDSITAFIANRECHKCGKLTEYVCEHITEAACYLKTDEALKAVNTFGNLKVISHKNPTKSCPIQNCKDARDRETIFGYLQSEKVFHKKWRYGLEGGCFFKDRRQ